MKKENIHGFDFGLDLTSIFDVLRQTTVDPS